MTKIPKKEFTFKKHMKVGEADAESDSRFLESCFIDTGDLEVLLDSSEPKSIVLGRTGVGKSALVEYIEKTCERVIRIEPEELALRHVSNSSIIKFFEEQGVDLDIFYNLLWQHTFAVELIKNKYDINTLENKISFMESMKERLSGNTKKLEALKYIEDWGEKFWVDTETRIKEFTKKLESNLQGSLSGGTTIFELIAKGSRSITQEERAEVVHHGRQIVNEVQIQKLSKIINLLAEDIFTDSQQKTYLVIDRLDEKWVDDELRYRLIRSLIETIKKFRNIEPVKIIITLRKDLLDRVLHKTRDYGFQREKYKTLFLELTWSKNQLASLIDKRINTALKHKYTNSEVSFNDVFPEKIDKVDTIDYILDRTLLRPRDAIMFINECFSQSQGKSQIVNSTIKLAEKIYSHERVESLCYEWYVEHPLLSYYFKFLEKRPHSFKVNTITKDEISSFITSLLEKSMEISDELTKVSHEYFNADVVTDELLGTFRRTLFFTLYKVGVVGIKIDGVTTVKWSNDKTQDLVDSQILATSIIYTHKILWRALAIDKRQ